MQLYNLDTKITDRSYQILDSHIKEQKELDNIRIGEIRVKCRDILEKNGIFEDRKNGIVYQNMENELKKLEENISYFNGLNLEELTRNKIDTGIENITVKLDSLEQNSDFSYLSDEYTVNRAYNENNIRNYLFNYFDNYKANTVDLLIKGGYSQNTIDNVENDILEYVTSKNSDILTEKFTQDGIKNMNSLNDSLEELSNSIIKEAEVRFNCQVNGTVYDELKEKRKVVMQKAKKLEDLMYQINSLESKANEISGSAI